MKRLTPIPFIAILAFALFLSLPIQLSAAEPDAGIRHSFLTLGGQTAIVGEDGDVLWSYRGGSRDGFVLPNGNVLAVGAQHAHPEQHAMQGRRQIASCNVPQVGS